MDVDVQSIVSDPFYLYEKASTSRNSTGYHVFLRCSFWRWKANAYSEERKMELIRSACRERVIMRLDEAFLLPPEFNKATDDPFDIAPFTSTDFKQDMMSVVAYHWNRLPEATKNTWRDHAERLNSRPLAGQFNALPLSYIGNNTHEQLHKVILKRDFSSFMHELRKKFKKYENKTGLYNKNEKVGDLVQKIEHKFYFFQTVPYTVILASVEHWINFMIMKGWITKQERLRHIIYCLRRECMKY